MKKYSKNILEGPLLPSIILYAIPIILTSLLQLLFNAADLAVVGQFCGSVSIASVGATVSITGLIVNLFIGLSTGAGVTVAQALGARDDRAVYQAVHTALPTALLGGAVLTIVGITCSAPLLRLMGTPDTVLPLSTVYMQIYFGGVIFTMVYNFCAAILRAVGDTKSPLIFLTIAGVINILLNLLFVIVFDMSVAGVSLATVISQAISAVLVVIALMRRTDACRLILKEIRFYKPQLLQIVRIGLPAGIQNSLFSIANVSIQSSVNSFGDTFMSGHTAAGNVESFAHVTSVGFSQAALNFSGQNAGAKQYKRVMRVSWICIASITVTSILLSSLTYLFREPLLSIYISDSSQAISYGVLRMSMLCPPYFLCGLMEVSGGILRGLGKSFHTMINSIIGICIIRVIWINTIFQIPQYHTPQCLYFVIVLSWGVTFALQFVSFLVFYRRLTVNKSPQPQIS